MPSFQDHQEALFAAALSRPASERAAFLDSACYANPILRQSVEARLTQCQQLSRASESVPHSRPQIGDTVGSMSAERPTPELLPLANVEPARPTINLDIAQDPADEAVGLMLGH